MYVNIWPSDSQEGEEQCCYMWLRCGMVWDQVGQGQNGKGQQAEGCIGQPEGGKDTNDMCKDVKAHADADTDTKASLFEPLCPCMMHLQKKTPEEVAIIRYANAVGVGGVH